MDRARFRSQQSSTSDRVTPKAQSAVASAIALFCSADLCFSGASCQPTLARSNLSLLSTRKSRCHKRSARNTLGNQPANTQQTGKVPHSITVEQNDLHGIKVNRFWRGYPPQRPFTAWAADRAPRAAGHSESPALPGKRHPGSGWSSEPSGADRAVPSPDREKRAEPSAAGHREALPNASATC